MIKTLQEANFLFCYFKPLSKHFEVLDQWRKHHGPNTIQMFHEKVWSPQLTKSRLASCDEEMSRRGFGYLLYVHPLPKDILT